MKMTNFWPISIESGFKWLLRDVPILTWRIHPTLYLCSIYMMHFLCEWRLPSTMSANASDRLAMINLQLQHSKFSEVGFHWTLERARCVWLPLILIPLCLFNFDRERWFAMSTMELESLFWIVLLDWIRYVWTWWHPYASNWWLDLPPPVVLIIQRRTPPYCLIDFFFCFRNGMAKWKSLW
jgi:hypothetical protein